MIRGVTTDGCMKPWSGDSSDHYDPNTGVSEPRSRYMWVDFSVWRGIYLLLVVDRYDVSDFLQLTGNTTDTMSNYADLDFVPPNYPDSVVDTHFYYIYNVTPAIDICLWIFLV